MCSSLPCMFQNKAINIALLCLSHAKWWSAPGPLTMDKPNSKSSSKRIEAKSWWFLFFFARWIASWNLWWARSRSLTASLPLKNGWLEGKRAFPFGSRYIFRGELLNFQGVVNWGVKLNCSPTFVANRWWESKKKHRRLTLCICWFQWRQWDLTQSRGWRVHLRVVTFDNLNSNSKVIKHLRGHILMFHQAGYQIVFVCILYINTQKMNINSIATIQMK